MLSHRFEITQVLTLSVVLRPRRDNNSFIEVAIMVDGDLTDDEPMLQFPAEYMDSFETFTYWLKDHSLELTTTAMLECMLSMWEDENVLRDK